MCSGYPAHFSTTGNSITWYDANGNLVWTGNNFTTPVLTNTTTYFAVDEVTNTGAIANGGKTDSLGGGSYFTGVQYEIFDALKPFVLKSVHLIEGR